MEMCKIVHNDYNRISDKVLWLSPEYILKFNVDLYWYRTSKNSPDKYKENFHKEFGYYSDNKFGVKINRDFNYYLSIESIRNRSSRAIIGPNSIYFLKYKLETVIEAWFHNDVIFSRKDGHIFIPTVPNPIRVNLDFDGYLEFEPAVTLINGEDTIGVNCFVNSETTYFFMKVDSLMSFNYLISNFNLYESAQLMLNYVGRPENGTNYKEITSEESPKGFFNRVQQQFDPGGS